MTASNVYPRLFTVEEANRLLPTVRSLFDRVYQRIEVLRGRGQKVIRHRELDPDSPEFMDKLKEDETISRVIKELHELVQEINDLGCICKGVEQGLVDFPCLLGDEIVFLCWQYGEEKISYWHRAEDGFAGRKPLLDAASGEQKTYH
ncbi:MAG TPA: DUF2203 domain-containing protein [Candidatus Acidoferrales bacterium]|nr:DUF2203 domain-containing protein [Candidatus Acidoferrales bacterium]